MQARKKASIALALKCDRIEAVLAQLTARGSSGLSGSPSRKETLALVKAMQPLRSAALGDFAPLTFNLLNVMKFGHSLDFDANVVAVAAIAR